ncbi:MAG: hypothetical protein WBP61_19115 [Nocardioides sp.]
MSRWMTYHGWKAGLVVVLVTVLLGPTNPLVYLGLVVLSLLCFWWGLAVRMKRSFREGYGHQS